MSNNPKETFEFISQLKEIINDYEAEMDKKNIDLAELKELKSGKMIRVSQLTHRKLSLLKLFYKCDTYEDLIKRIIDTPVSLFDDKYRSAYDQLLKGFIEKKKWFINQLKKYDRLLK